MTRTVCPLRYSADPAAMIGFLATLGLLEVDQDPDGSSARFTGSSGQVRVHTARPATDLGRTVLTLVGDEDEESITTPGGLGVVRVGPGASRVDPTDQRVAASMAVVAICTVPDPGAEQEFWSGLGFRAIETGEGYLPLTADGDAGVIGLRAGDRPGVALGVETSEPFDALADRMRAAGHPAETVTDSSGVWVRITDPDAATVEVRPTR